MGGVNEIYTKYEIDNKLDNINLVVDDKLDEYVKNEVVNDIISEKINPLSNKYDELEKEQKEIDNKFNNYNNKNYTAKLEERISSLEDNITALNKHIEDMELSNKLKDALSFKWIIDSGHPTTVTISETDGICKYTADVELNNLSNEYLGLIIFTPGDNAEYQSGYAGFYINKINNKQTPVSGNMKNNGNYKFGINVEDGRLMLMTLGSCNKEFKDFEFKYFINPLA